MLNKDNEPAVEDLMDAVKNKVEAHVEQYAVAVVVVCLRIVSACLSKIKSQR